ncbi:DUF5610 domain-containing protein [Halopseudomonas salina]|uniref:DUF5610 domain-containing protein n=1 Tax=Halopseudomonas salina TaxID=1323744 RepID=A0ABQ1PGN5_9GAMM|nr:DUF5610 domain-containing protein [Halopseudomonas salina]GGC96959.1 hypothetical protein GCM10007418_15470 [Halopseudomonas salina]
MSQSNSITPGGVRQTAPSQANAARQIDGQKTLANRLAEQMGLKPGSLAGSADNFSPGKVAERVLGFIGGRLESAKAAGEDTSKLQTMYDQAAKGVEKGFEEARKILDGMGVLKGKVAADIDDTWQRIQTGMAEIAERLLPSAEQNGRGEGVSLSASASRFSAQAQTFDLEVTTREGDRLRISIAQASASRSDSQVTASSGPQGSRVALSSQSSQLQVGAWQVEVQGDLNDAERESLQDLLGQVQDLAGAFYAGDRQGAFDRALALDLDGSQLASMSLNLTQTSVRQVSEAYGRVSGQGAPASAANNDLREYAQGLVDALRTASELSESGNELLRGLLDGGFAIDERFDQPRLEKAMDLNQRLLEGLQALQTNPQSQAEPEQSAE